MPTRTPRLFTIPPSVPFLPALIEALLAGRLIADFPGSREPMALAQATLYLPTRRACRLAQDVFLDALGGDATILPRLVPIGDIDEDEIAFAEFAGGPLAADRLARERAIEPFERKALLTQMILKWAGSRERDVESSLIANSPASAFAMAGELARLQDDMITRGVAWSALDTLIPDEMDRYFADTLDFLKIAREHWPELLRERGAIDAAARRDALIDLEAARLERDHAGPVIAAGSTASMPATTKLLAAIARLANGAVVLPGLDTDLDEPAWDAIGGGSEGGNPSPGHPQFAMQAFLRGIGARRDQVEVLATAAPHSRERLASEAMRPVEATDRWRVTLNESGFKAGKAASLAGLSLIEAAITEEEAVAVALVLREAVGDGTPESAERTAALITPDRALARRVLAALERWKVPVDDSGGDPLSDTQAGIFARLAAEAALNGCEPVNLLALVKHPLCRLGGHEFSQRPAIALLERALLRGPRPRAGIAGLDHALQSLRAERDRLHGSDPRRRLSERDLDRAADLIARLRPALAPLADVTSSALRDLAIRHHAVVAALSRDHQGEPAAFAGRDGGLLLGTFQAMTDSGHAAGFAVAPHEYADLFRTIASEVVVRRPGAPGARVRIYGPLEARLQQADRVVLAGLVEGVWPPDPRGDPWLNRPMRQQLGLDLPERRIGLSAHDFVQAFGAREVVLSHSAKREGSPTVVSRFVQRLAAVAGPEEWAALKVRGTKYLDWARALDRPAQVQAAKRPEPRPPVALRPKRLPVTDIEHWLRDPYTIYGKHILRLRPLDPVDTPPGARDRGTVIHKAIGDFTAKFANGLPADPLSELMTIGREAFAPLNDYPEAQAFWWPRFDRIARWFIDWEVERRSKVQSVYAEVPGELQVTDDFLLTARADRIERLTDGSFAVLDYKTGRPPSKKEVQVGFAPQLTLQAAILRHGEFRNVPAGGPVSELLYLRLSGGDPGGEKAPRDFENLRLDDAADRALDKLKELVATFALEETPYLSFWRPMWVGRTYGDYDHLARVREWSAIGGEFDPDMPA